jgi:hypothetical protein
MIQSEHRSSRISKRLVAGISVPDVWARNSRQQSPTLVDALLAVSKA